MLKQIYKKASNQSKQLNKIQNYSISSYQVGNKYTRADIIRKVGSDLVHEPLHYKGMAFTRSERDRLSIRGLVPPGYMTLDDQVDLLMQEYNEGWTEKHQNDELLSSSGICPDNTRKWKVLQSIHDRNETLYYKILDEHFEEMAPVIYTPTVGWACVNYSNVFRRPRGMFFTAADKGEMAVMVRNWQENDVDAIVITDGSRVLGLGDLGINGMGISIGKLDLYVAAGGFHPMRVLPIVFDVGTNNKELREQREYIGLRQERIDGEEYYELLDELMSALYLRWPKALIQFEDFQLKHAITTLRRYRNHYLMFNDDIQGTAATVLAGILGSLKLLGQDISDLMDKKIVLAGAGSAGSGAAIQIVRALQKHSGQSQTKIAKKFWILDQDGLITHQRANFDKLQEGFSDLHDFAKSGTETNNEGESLVETIKRIQPDILIGLTGVGGLFNQEVIEAMSAGCERPIIMPLSNPTSKSECTHEQAMVWSKGKAVFSSGSPFDPVEVNGVVHNASQCNNKYIFPGLALGAMLGQTGEITNGMITAAAQALPELIQQEDLDKGIVFPSLRHPKDIARYLAAKVIQEADREGLKIRDPRTREVKDNFNELMEYIRRRQWYPEYRNLIYVPPGVDE